MLNQVKQMTECDGLNYFHQGPIEITKKGLPIILPSVKFYEINTYNIYRHILLIAFVQN